MPQITRTCITTTYQNQNLEGSEPNGQITLFGSLRRRYFPGGCFMQWSMMHLRMPHALSRFRVILVANSVGLYCCVPRITWFALLKTFARDTYLQHTPTALPHLEWFSSFSHTFSILASAFISNTRIRTATVDHTYCAPSNLTTQRGDAYCNMVATVTDAAEPVTITEAAK